MNDYSCNFHELEFVIIRILWDKWDDDDDDDDDDDLFVGYTAAETCSADGDCKNTICDASHDLECHRGQCTCVNHATG